MAVSNSTTDANLDAITQLLAEIEAGEGLTMGSASRVLGGIGPSTVFRFITRGSKSESGEIVHLGATRIGSRWWTTRPAIIRFTHALTAIAEPMAASNKTVSAKKKFNASSAKLQAMGC